MTMIIPQRPDYDQKLAWAHLPEQTADQDAIEADVFYAPGTLISGGAGYYDTFNPEHRILAARPRKVQASVFNGVARVYQPHCRQVSMEVNLLPAKEMRAAYQVSIDDMKRAFLHYLEHWNRGRPFFLLGHSQGSILLLELMKDVMGDTAVYSRMVAAYLIGFSVTQKDLAAHQHMKLAKSADDTGVIITYNTLSRDAGKALTLLPGALCVNPLNWVDSPEYADRSLNLGRVDFDIDGHISREYPQFTDAWIDPGVGALRVGLESADLETGNYFPAGDFHQYNFTFFYRNLAQNTGRRLTAFMSSRGSDLGDLPGEG